MNLGEKIKLLRDQNGYSQEKLAGILFVSRDVVDDWENNKTLPDVNKIKQISALFDVSIDYLLSDEEYITGDKNYDGIITEEKKEDNTIDYAKINQELSEQEIKYQLAVKYYNNHDYESALKYLYSFFF